MSEGDELLRRFVEQGSGAAKPEYPRGKLTEDDEGALVFGIGLMEDKKTIIVNFNKSVTWLGLDRETAVALRDKLSLLISKLED